MINMIKKLFYTNTPVAISGTLILAGTVLAIKKLNTEENPYFKKFNVRKSMGAYPSNYFNPLALPIQDWEVHPSYHAKITDPKAFMINGEVKELSFHKGDANRTAKNDPNVK